MPGLLVEQFEEIVLKAMPDGRLIKLKHVARVELGAKNQDVGVRFDRLDAAFIVIFQTPDANALETRDLRAGVQFSRNGVRSGIENGDVLFASLCWVQVALIRFAAGDPLDDRGLLPGPVLDGLSRPPARLYQVRAVVPRLRFVARARPLHRDADLAAALSDPAYDPGGAVLLDDAAGGALADGDEGGVSAADGEAVITQETPERITMRVSTTGPGYAVLADAYAPGWRATLDDRPVPILRADGLFRAVALPAGEHTVEMEYRPADVVAGLGLGLLGVLLVTVYGIAARSRAW